jgi:predicted nuclease with TOPRIM domain
MLVCDLYLQESTMPTLSSETLTILSKIDDMGKETRAKVDTIGKENRTQMQLVSTELRGELSKVTGEIANVRDRLGKLEGANRGQNIELRDLKIEQLRLEDRQEEITKTIDNKIRDHESRTPEPVAKERNSYIPKKIPFTMPRWVVAILTSLGIAVGGSSIAILKSCNNEIITNVEPEQKEVSPKSKKEIDIVIKN